MTISENTPSIALQSAGIFKRYKNGTEAVRGIDLTVNSGESISILGPNGAGKTSFLRILTTELRPTDGSVNILGIDAIAEPQAAKTNLGVTPQEAGVFETLRLREHLALFGRLKGLSKLEANTQTERLLGDLGLKDSLGKRVGDLSGGQRRRLLIGLALIGGPPLLILDEPTTGLDPVSRREVWDLLKKIISNGTTLIFSTHYMEEAEFLSDRIAFINAGKIVALGTLEELQSRFPLRYRLRFTLDTTKRKTETLYFETFGKVQAFLADAEPEEYQIATSSLEDVYLSLAGEQLEANGGRFSGYR